MTPLISIGFGLVVAALSALVLVALVAATALLILLALVALDVLLERNGVDRRAGVVRLWTNLRRPSARGPRTAEPATSEAPSGGSRRIPFSARLHGRSGRPAAAEPASQPETAAPAPAATAAPRWATAPAPDVIEESRVAPEAEVVTEVLAVEVPPAARSASRTTAATPRTRAPRATGSPVQRSPRSAPTAAAATPPAPPAPEPAPAADRDSAIDRLFAPLLESDRTEPLPRARSARRPSDEA